MSTNLKDTQTESHSHGPDSKILGLIGLGLMGRPIALRLLDHGYRLQVFDRDREKAAELLQHGASAASSVAELARGVDIILSLLPDDDAVLQVYSGPRGVFAYARPDAVVLDMSTVRPETSRQLYSLGKERSVHVLDVAISDSTPVAETGALTLLAGGAKAVFEAATPIFAAIAKQYFYMGPNGSGTSTKLVANTLLGVGMQAIAEAAALGEKAGIERRLLFDVMAKLAVVAPAYIGKFARAKERDYSAQFPIRLMNKDFRLILEKAAELHVPMPVTSSAFQINSVESARSPEEDFSAVIRTMEELANLRRDAAAA